MSPAPLRLLSRPIGQSSRWVPWSLPVLLLAWLAAQHVDMALARGLFHWQGDAWSLKRSLLLENGLHRGGRLLGQAAWTGVLVATLLRWRSPSSRTWTRPAARLLLSVLASVACVAALKAVTHMDCPWDLAGLGGDRAFIGLFETRPASLGPAACFPAAHAAGGFAWVALYFFFLHTAPRWRHAGLAVGLLAGALFGLAQQLRGAHFLSHDVASLMVCWTIACAVEAVGARSPVEAHA